MDVETIEQHKNKGVVANSLTTDVVAVEQQSTNTKAKKRVREQDDEENGVDNGFASIRKKHKLSEEKYALRTGFLHLYSDPGVNISKKRELLKEAKSRIEPSEYNLQHFNTLFNILTADNRIFKDLADDLPTSLALLSVCKLLTVKSPTGKKLYSDLNVMTPEYFRYTRTETIMLICAKHNYAERMLDFWHGKYGILNRDVVKTDDPHYDCTGMCVTGTAARYGSLDVLNLFRDRFNNNRFFPRNGWEANIFEWAIRGRASGLNNGCSETWIKEFLPPYMSDMSKDYIDYLERLR